MSNLPTIVIGVPGKWPDRTAIIEAIALQSGGYLFAGGLMMNIESKWTCSLEVYEADPNMRTAFEVAGGGRFSDAELGKIEDHTFTLYLSSDGGSLERCRTLMDVASALLDCGGLGVKIESSGVAHTAARWRELTAADIPHAILTAYVTYVGDSSEYYSCGMHHLGFRDPYVSGNISANDAAILMHELNKYIVFEEAVINDGETFGVDSEAPRYRVHKKACEEFASDDLFHNPYGIWHLTEANVAGQKSD